MCIFAFSYIHGAGKRCVKDYLNPSVNIGKTRGTDGVKVSVLKLIESFVTMRHYSHDEEHFSQYSVYLF